MAAAMASRAAILAVAAVAALAVVQLAAAADHPVGGTGAWDASGTNYNAWAAKQTIKQGDTVCKLKDQFLSTQSFVLHLFTNCLDHHSPTHG
jgi:invasion protein IalB